MKLEQAPRNGLLSAASRNSDDRNKHPAASALPSTAPPPPPPPPPMPFFHRKRKWISSTRATRFQECNSRAQPPPGWRNICPRPVRNSCRPADRYRLLLRTRIAVRMADDERNRFQLGCTDLWDRREFNLSRGDR